MTTDTEKFIPWNKNRIIGYKEPFSKNHIKKLRSILKKEGRQFELVLFSIGVDTGLRSSDLRNLKVEDVKNPSGYINKAIRLKQQKTNMPHVVWLSDYTIAELLFFLQGKHERDFLFQSSKFTKPKPISLRWHSKLVKGWAQLLDLKDSSFKDFATHSTRRTLATFIYDQTKDMVITQQTMGHKDVNNTIKYLNLIQKKTFQEVSHCINFGDEIEEKVVVPEEIQSAFSF